MRYHEKLREQNKSFPKSTLHNAHKTAKTFSERFEKTSCRRENDFDKSLADLSEFCMLRIKIKLNRFR